MAFERTREQLFEEHPHPEREDGTDAGTSARPGLLEASDATIVDRASADGALRGLGGVPGHRAVVVTSSAGRALSSRRVRRCR